MSELPDEIAAAIAFMRGHLRGLIRFDTEYLPIRVVFAPDGRIVAPVMESMLLSTDCALYLPEEPEDQEERIVQLMVTLERFEESGPLGPLADRWRIYHGEPDDVRWATFTPDFCKFAGYAFDGEAVTRPNPLASGEASICRAVNEDRVEDLGRLVVRRNEVELEDPRMVGIDPLGMDVRGRFEIARIDFHSPVEDVTAATDLVEGLLDETS